MFKIVKTLWPMACLLAMAASVAAAPVQEPPAHAKQTKQKKSDKPVTLQQAVEQAKKHTGGRVLAADTIRSRHGSKYRIKMLTDKGRVRVIEVDSKPGAKPDANSAKNTNKEKH